MDSLEKRLNDMACTANSLRSNDAVDKLLMDAAMRIVLLQTALVNLADAADTVGVRFFDTDTMEPEVQAMQEATQEARTILQYQPAA